MTELDQLISRRDALQAANNATKDWGAAVAARMEEIDILNAEITRRSKTTTASRIIALLDGTLTASQIAEQAKCNISYVYFAAQRAEMSHLIVPAHQYSRQKLLALFNGSYTYAEISELSGYQIDGVRTFASRHNLSHMVARNAGPRIRVAPHVLEWLTKETPEGASIWDTASAIITDAYYEELEATNIFAPDHKDYGLES